MQVVRLMIAGAFVATGCAAFGASDAELAKARTLGDSCVRMQKGDGRIPTVWNTLESEDIQQDWVNCTLETLRALQELDEVTETKEDGR